MTSANLETPNSLILASSSKYRQSLIKRLHLPTKSIAPEIDESVLSGENAPQLVKRLAIEKARCISKSYPDHWVIGSDQVAQLDNKIIGKPCSRQNAINQLIQCSGKTLQFISGLALCHHRLNQTLYAESTVEVKFLKLNQDQIIKYLDIDKPFDCAGSFKVESLGISLFEWVKSDDPSSLEGMSLISLCKLLRRAGIDPLG